MEEETPNPMNLDLNLGRLDRSHDDADPRSESFPIENMTDLENWLDVHRLGEAARRSRQRWQSPWRQFQVPPEARNTELEFIGENGSQAGEGSVVAKQRPTEVTKSCDDDKCCGDCGSVFYCNICLDLPKDPVVTCCGHLFCWPCLYRWLYVHSDAKNCPVCKGEVSVKTVTPIYGRGKSARWPEDDSGLKIPLRPPARRVENRRQAIQRTAFGVPMQEMIRRLGSRFDLSQVHPDNINIAAQRESPQRSNPLFNRILTSRGLPREQHNVSVIPPDDVVDLTQSNPANSEAGESRHTASPILQRINSSTAGTISDLASVLSSAERLVESYFQNQPLETNQEQPQPLDDRDSFSSIIAAIHSESLTVDNVVEIDSTVSLSTSSSRRRNDASRISDVDSGDSLAPRRRRLN